MPTPPTSPTQPPSPPGDARAQPRPADTPAARRGAAVISVVVAVGLAFAAVGLRQTRAPPSGLQGQRVAPLTLPRITEAATADVERVEIGRGVGRPTLVHFWGPSCGPCVQEAPAIDRLAAAGVADGFVVWTVTGEDVVDVRDLMARLQLRFVVLQDADGAAHQAFRVSAIPHSFVLDGAGVVVREFVGPQDAATLHEALRAAQN